MIFLKFLALLGALHILFCGVSLVMRKFTFHKGSKVSFLRHRAQRLC